MNTQLQTFQNNALTANIRCAINEADGSVWFVAGDMAKALEYTRTDAMLSHCEDSAVLPQLNKINSLAPATKWINESDLYSAIFGSTKPEAKIFKKWVTSEVLPTIRKTGKYEAPTPEKAQPIVVSTTAKAMMSMAKAFGFKGNQAAIYADRATERMIDVSPLKLMGATLVDEAQELQIGATELGILIGLGRNKVNPHLEELGFVTGSRDKKGNLIWELTEKGKATGGTYIVTGKAHGDGRPVMGIKWSKDTILKALDSMEVVK